MELFIVFIIPLCLNIYILYCKNINVLDYETPQTLLGCYIITVKASYYIPNI